ncbi:MAG: hypothetical protein LBS29_05965 [Endomicrobium sp.]|jgi:hypothetical protein|nr:hypothetical protein [Endomicrobium sp.]
MEAINSLSKSYGVKITYASSNGMIEREGKLEWSAMKLDVNGFQDAEKSFRLCGQSNSCIN